MVQNKIKSIYLKYLKGEQITITPEDHTSIHLFAIFRVLQILFFLKNLILITLIIILRYKNYV